MEINNIYVFVYLTIVGFIVFFGCCRGNYESGKEAAQPSNKFGFKLGDRIIGTHCGTTGDRSFLESPVIIKRIFSHHFEYEWTVKGLKGVLGLMTKEDARYQKFIKIDWP